MVFWQIQAMKSRCIRYETDSYLHRSGRELAELELSIFHPDFEQIRQDNAFHDWVKSKRNGSRCFV